MNAIRDLNRPTPVAWLRVAAVVCLAGMLILAAPLIWTAVKAGLGLLALAAMLATGYAAVQALPLLGQALENRLLAARKGEARRNPIEQMQNHLLHRARQINSFRQALATIYGQIEGMQDMLADRRRTAPQHNLSKQEAAVQKMTAFYVSNVKKLGAAEAALGEYQKHVEMKVFEGLSRQEIADRLECSVRTVARHWDFSQVWLKNALRDHTTA